MIYSDTTTTRPISNRPGAVVRLCAAGEAYLASRGYPSIFMSFDGSKRYGYPSVYRGDVAGEMATLAREIIGARPRQRVRYINGDRTDLRLANLRLERGAARGQSANPRRIGSDL